MKLKPRHYLLLALLIALGVWNFVRSRRAREAASVGVSVSGSPAWQAFDRAAALRDAPETQFAPALDALHAQTEAANGPDATDLRSCQLWLAYYRHSAASASGRAGDWAMLATNHVHTCMTTHHDTGR